MDTTYDVRVWSIQENAGARGKTYVVRWRVAGRRWKATFKTAALADSFRSDLLAAALAAAAGDAGPLTLGLAAGSFASGTRVVGSDPAFVTAMVEGNAGPTAAALDAVRAQLDRPWPELVAAGRK